MTKEEAASRSPRQRRLNETPFHIPPPLAKCSSPDGIGLLQPGGSGGPQHAVGITFGCGQPPDGLRIGDREAMSAGAKVGQGGFADIPLDHEARGVRRARVE